MSAVPKKKLCWNCDGNIAKEIDNCPYCGVYLLATDDSDENRWNPDYSDEQKNSVPSPLYQMQQETNDEEIVTEKTPFLSSEILRAIKLDLGPILMLMGGSVFFLFSIILLLFAQDGLLTLQWNGSNWIYFLGLSVPLIFVGWRLLQQTEHTDTI